MTEAALEAREPGERHRRGGRAGKRAGGSSAFEQPALQKYRVRFQPTNHVSEDELESIHLASLRVLKEIGVDVLHDEARAIMKRMAPIVREGEVRVRFDADMILELIAHAPPEFTIHARNPANNQTFRRQQHHLRADGVGAELFGYAIAAAVRATRSTTGIS